MALVPFRQILDHPEYKSADLGRQREIVNKYWDNYDQENPNDDWSKQQRDLTNQILDTKERVKDASPFEQRIAGTELNYLNKQFQFSTAEKENVGTPEARQAFLKEADSQVEGERKKVAKTLSLFDPEVNKQMQPAWQALQKSALNSGYFEGNQTIRGADQGLNLSDDQRQSLQNYTQFRDQLASDFYLKPEEVDDVVRHRLDLQTEPVSRDALGQLHIKDSVMGQDVTGIQRAIFDSSLPDSVKSKLSLDVPQRLSVFKQSVVESVKKQHPELASEISWSGDVDKDYSAITGKLNTDWVQQAAGGATSGFLSSAQRASTLTGGGQLTTPSGIPYNPTGMSGSQADASVDRVSSRQESINQLSSFINDEKTKIFGVDAATVGGGVYSVAESAALAATTGGLGNALIPASRIAAAGPVGKAALTFAKGFANVAPVAAYGAAGEATQTYEQAIKAGFSPEKAMKTAATAAAIEFFVTGTFSGIPGMGGVEDFVSRLLTPAAKAGLKASLLRAGQAFGTNIVGENAEEGTNSLLNTLAVQSKLNPSMTKEDLLQNLKATAISTTIASAPFGAVEAAVKFKPTYEQSTDELRRTADDIAVEHSKGIVPQEKAQGGDVPPGSTQPVVAAEPAAAPAAPVTTPAEPQPGSPVTYKGEQAVVVDSLGDGQLRIKLPATDSQPEADMVVAGSEVAPVEVSGETGASSGPTEALSSLQAVHYSREPLNLEKGKKIQDIPGRYQEESILGEGFYAMEPQDEKTWTEDTQRFGVGPFRNEVQITPKKPVIITPQNMKDVSIEEIRKGISSGKYDAVIIRGFDPNVDFTSKIMDRVDELWSPKFPEGKTSGKFINVGEYEAALEQATQEIVGTSNKKFNEIRRAGFTTNQIFIPKDSAPDIVIPTTTTNENQVQETSSPAPVKSQPPVQRAEGQAQAGTPQQESPDQEKLIEVNNIIFDLLGIKPEEASAVEQPLVEPNGQMRLFQEGEQDRAYMDAVERGDMETAQRMVDEAAKAAGYSRKLWHGRKTSFTEFRTEGSPTAMFLRGAYLTNLKKYADKFGDASEFYVKLTQPYTTTDSALRRRLKKSDPSYNKYGGHERATEKVTVELKAEGYDGAVIERPAGAEGFDQNFAETVVFNPSQIKSADPVTYDADGNVIPLSQRFNPESPSILYQGQQPKGQITFNGLSEAVIQFFGSADPSTAWHETAHLVRRFLLRKSIPTDKRLGISDEMIDAVNDFVGAKGEVWTDAQEEKFARAWERYLWEGVTTGIKAVDDVLKTLTDFMRNIYQNIKGKSIDVELTPEIRSVFDSLVTRGQALREKGVAPTLLPVKVKVEAKPQTKPQVKAATKTETEEDKAVSLKKKEIEKYLSEIGLEAPVKSFVQSNQDSWEAALKKVVDNPRYGSNLVDRILKGEVALTNTVDRGVILYEYITRKIARKKAVSAFNSNPTPENRKAMDVAQADVISVTDASVLSASETGRALQFQKFFTKEDLSLEGMQDRYRAEINDGEPLNDEQLKHVAKIHKELTEAIKAREELEKEYGIVAAERDALLKRLEEKKPRATSDRRSLTERVKERAQSARDRLKARGLGPTVLEQRGEISGAQKEMAQYVAEQYVKDLETFLQKNPEGNFMKLSAPMSDTNHPVRQIGSLPAQTGYPEGVAKISSKGHSDNWWKSVQELAVRKAQGIIQEDQQRAGYGMSPTYPSVNSKFYGPKTNKGSLSDMRTAGTTDPVLVRENKIKQLTDIENQAKANDVILKTSVDREGGIRLNSIETAKDKRGEGRATSVVKDLIKVADRTASRITLEVDPWGSMNRYQIAKWYRSLGFEGEAVGDMTYTSQGWEYARHAELERKFNEGTITEAEVEEAKNLVAKYAKKEGFTTGPVWHGSPNPEIEVFDPKKAERRIDSGRYGLDVVYFSTEEEANKYNWVYDKGNWKQTPLYKVFLKLQNPLIVPSGMSFWTALEDAVGKREADIIGRSLAESRDKYGMADLLNKYGYDGVYEVEAAYQGNVRPIWATTSPTQIKSAEPFTGVPLSQRFNPESPSILYQDQEPVLSAQDIADFGDIAATVTPEQDAAYLAAVEAGDMETAQRMVDEAAKAAGAFAPIATSKAAVSDEDSGAYHYGDAGIGSDTRLHRMSPGRSTGHFGTGTYFFGKRQTNARGGRPEVFLDLTGLNLIKTKDPERLHSGLRGVNKIVMHGVEPDTENPSSEYQRVVSNLWFGLNYKLPNEQIADTIEEIRTLFNKGKQDGLRTPSTYFMQVLGFDGIDVRGTDLDNGDYGSVVYPPLADSYWYHGKSPDKIEVFDFKKSGKNTDDGGGGVWLSSNIDVSKTYRQFVGSEVPFYRLENLESAISELTNTGRHLVPAKDIDLAVDQENNDDVYFYNRGEWKPVGKLSRPETIQSGMKIFGYTFYKNEDLILKSHVLAKNPLIIEEGGKLKTQPWGSIVRAAKNAGHDSVVFVNTIDTRGAFTRETGNRFIGNSLVVFSPEQIKSADPVTYDADGNVIPLSQRFNPESPSILYQGSELSTQDIEDLGDIAASMILDNKTDQEIEEQLGAEFGKVALDNINLILDAARGQLAKTAAGSRAKTPIELFNLLDPENPELSNKLVFNMVRGFINQGVPKEKVLKKVHDLLKEKFPDLTFDELSDIFTGYGKIKEPDPAADLKAVRELRNIERIQRQIRELKAGNTPKKTGQQRDAATARIRELQKELREAFRKSGIRSTTKRTELRGALDAIKSRLKNELVDLERAIQTKTKLPSKRTSVEYDQEVLDLQKKRDAVRKEYDKHFGINRKAMSDSQRLKNIIKSLNKRIVEEKSLAYVGMVNRIKSSTRKVSSAEADRLRATLNGLVDIREKARAALYPSISEEGRALKRAAKDAERQIAYYQKLKAGIPVDKKSPLNMVPGEELARLWSLRDALKKAVVEMRKEQRRALAKSPDAKAREASIRALERSVKVLEERVRKGDLSRRSRNPLLGPLTSAETELKKRQEAAQAALKALREAKLPTKEERKEAALIKASVTRRNKISQRIANNDYIKIEPTPKVVSRKLAEAQLAERKIKEEWNRGFFEKQLKERSRGQIVWDTSTEIVNFSRATMTSLDVSAPGRQGIVTLLMHPILSSRSIPLMFRSAFSEVRHQEFLNKLEKDPYYAIATSAKLFMPDADQGSTVSKLEEDYRGRWAKELKLTGWFVKGSERAYNAYLSSVRLKHFKAIAGMIPDNQMTKKEAEVIADFVNKCTGRGNLKDAESSAAILAHALFSPKFLVSRFQVILGIGTSAYGSTLGPKELRRVKRLIAMEYGRFFVGISAVYSLGALVRAALDDEEDKDKPFIETDPRSSKFGQMRFGKTFIDGFGGLLQAATLMSRLIPTRKNGEWSFYTKTSKGEVTSLRLSGFGQQSVSTVVGQFLRGKMAPLPSTALTLWDGKDVMGKPASVRAELIGTVLPLSSGDVYNIYKEHGVKGTPLAILSLFGTGVRVHNEDLGLEQEISTWIGVDPQFYKNKSSGDVKGISVKPF